MEAKCRNKPSEVITKSENQIDKQLNKFLTSVYIWVAKRCKPGVLLCGVKLSDRAKVGLGGWRFLSYNTIQNTHLFSKDLGFTADTLLRISIPFLQYYTKQTALYSRCTKSVLRFPRAIVLCFYNISWHFSKP